MLPTEEVCATAGNTFVESIAARSMKLKSLLYIAFNPFCFILKG